MRKFYVAKTCTKGLDFAPDELKFYKQLQPNCSTDAECALHDAADVIFVECHSVDGKWTDFEITENCTKNPIGQW